MNRESSHARSPLLSEFPCRTDRFKLQALIDEATTDSVDESDEHAGLVGMVREEVDCPFQARLLGEVVECLRLEWPKSGWGLEAVCRTSKGKLRTVDVGQLELLDPLPRGYRWLEAYLTWRSRMD